MKHFSPVDLVIGASTVVGGSMVLIYGHPALAELSGPGLVVFLCFLIVAGCLGWKWLAPRVMAGKRDGPDEPGER